MMRKDDLEVLRYAGFLGHTLAVVASDRKGERHVALETCDRKHAKQATLDPATGGLPIAYLRTKRGWRVL